MVLSKGDLVAAGNAGATRAQERFVSETRELSGRDSREAENEVGEVANPRTEPTSAARIAADTIALRRFELAIYTQPPVEKRSPLSAGRHSGGGGNDGPNHTTNIKMTPGKPSGCPTHAVP